MVDKTICKCGDHKVSGSQCIEGQTYILLNTEDLLTALAGGTSISKLDLSHAYQQLFLDEGSEKDLMFCTHRGCESVTASDVILIAVSSEEEHLKG